MMSMTPLVDSVMEDSSEHPVVRQRISRRNRKYGRHEFERFDDFALDHASIGSATIGKAHIDCRFLFTKSKWGVLGGSSTQAGIIYLDLTFHQPKRCRLYSATVTVSLEEEQNDIRGELPPTLSRTQPVLMTQYFGPHVFMGPETTVQKKKAVHFNPNLHIGAFGGGLGEVRKELASTCSSRWKFSGRLLSSGEKDWGYNALQWELSPNDFETQSNHNNVLHTAFAFQHGRQPFYMRVDIEAQLKGFRDQVRSKVANFLASTKKDGAAATLISFKDHQVFSKPLDSRAENLRFEMEQANLQSIPMEVPGPQQVMFHTTTPTAQPSASANDMALLPSSNWSYRSATSGSTTSQVDWRLRPPVSNDLPSQRGSATKERARAATAENLARILDSSPLLDQAQQLDAQRHTAAEMTVAREVSEDAWNKNTHRKLKIPTNDIARASYMSGLLALLKLVIALQSLFAWTAAVLLKMTSGQENELSHGITEKEDYEHLRGSLDTTPQRMHERLAKDAWNERPLQP